MLQTAVDIVVAALTPQK